METFGLDKRYTPKFIYILEKDGEELGKFSSKRNLIEKLEYYEDIQLYFNEHQQMSEDPEEWMLENIDEVLDDLGYQLLRVLK